MGHAAAGSAVPALLRWWGRARPPGQAPAAQLARASAGGRASLPPAPAELPSAALARPEPRLAAGGGRPGGAAVRPSSAGGEATAQPPPACGPAAPAAKRARAGGRTSSAPAPAELAGAALARPAPRLAAGRDGCPGGAAVRPSSAGAAARADAGRRPRAFEWRPALHRGLPWKRFLPSPQRLGAVGVPAPSYREYDLLHKGPFLRGKLGLSSQLRRKQA